MKSWSEFLSEGAAAKVDPKSMCSAVGKIIGKLEDDYGNVYKAQRIRKMSDDEYTVWDSFTGGKSPSTATISFSVNVEIGFSFSLTVANCNKSIPGVEITPAHTKKIVDEILAYVAKTTGIQKSAIKMRKDGNDNEYYFGAYYE